MAISLQYVNSSLLGMILSAIGPAKREKVECPNTVRHDTCLRRRAPSARRTGVPLPVDGVVR
jgi:hypothetical protein